MKDRDKQIITPADVATIDRTVVAGAVGALAKTESYVPVKSEVPDYLQRFVHEGGEARGLEDADRKDFAIPRVAVCQSLTPQKKKSNSNYVEGLEEGDLFNNVSGRIYTRPLRVVPVKFFKSRIFFAPIESGGGILCQSTNGVDGGTITPKGCHVCPHSMWSTPDNPAGAQPACTELMNYACIVLGPEGPELAVLSLKSAAIKVAKQWNSQMRMLGGGKLDTFAGFYDVTTAEERSGGNSWFQVVIRPAGFVPPELYIFCEQQFQALSQKAEIKVAGDEGLADDRGSGLSDEV